MCNNSLAEPRRPENGWRSSGSVQYTYNAPTLCRVNVHTHIVHTWVGERAGDKRVEAALNREEPWSHLSSADLGASSKQSFDHLTQNIWLTWMAEVEKGSALNTIAVRCDAG